MTADEVKEIFRSEFKCIADKFEIIEESLQNLQQSEKPYVFHPGVYVFINDDGVIKIGRNLTISRRRALEHLHENTRTETFEMKNMLGLPDAKVLLFNLKEPGDFHWAAAVEVFFEMNLAPKIKSGRL